MDKDILRQYESVLKEIEDEEKRILSIEKEIAVMRPEQREVTDVVSKGKRGRKALGTCRIHGYEDHKDINKKTAQLRKRRANKARHITMLDDMVCEAEDYIYSLPESETRRLLQFRLIDKRSWNDVAIGMGEGYTAEACRQAFSRFMRVK